MRKKQFEVPPAVDSVAYDVASASLATGIGTSNIYEALATGTLRSKRIGRKHIIPKSWLEEFVNSLPEEWEREGVA